MNDRTEIDLILNTYWQNYQNNVPIDMLYESQLRQCTLDESIDSLKVLDGFLSNVRRDVQDKLAKAGRTLSAEQRKSLLLKDVRFRRLVQFIGFYTGKVLSRVWKSQLICLDSAALQAMNPHYLSADAFEHSLVIIFADIHKRRHLQNTQINTIREPWLFFVIEPIFMRLFGGFDYQFVSIQGKSNVANGLYKAVLERLPEAVVEQINQKQLEKQQQEMQAISEQYQREQSQLQQQHLQSQQRQSQLAQANPAIQPNTTSITSTPSIPASGSITGSMPTVEVGGTATSLVTHAQTHHGSIAQLSPQTQTLPQQMPSQSVGSHANLNNQHQSQLHSSIEPSAFQTNNVNQTNMQQMPQSSQPAASVNAHQEQPALSQPQSVASNQLSQSQNIIGNQYQSIEEHVSADILAEIHSFQVSQSHGEQQYLQASQVMNKFDKYAEKQRQQFGKLSSELTFDPIQVKNRVNALKVMKSVADAGNTTAMLHLSSYLLAGKWVKQNIEQAVGLIQQAANSQDARAMRALSRLYYQGIGVNQDNAMGKHWIQQAASLGHPEAQQIVNQFNIAQSMLAERASEDKSDKMYLYVIAAIAIISLLVIILF